MTTPAGASAGGRQASRVDTNAPATGRLTAEIVQDWSALGALAPEWNRLLEGSRANTIFLTWEWISAWRDTIGSRARPFVVGVRDEHGTLVALAPFYRTTASLLGVVPYKVLRVMADYATSAEYGSWIVRADCEAQASRTLGEALRKAQRAWDCIWMSKVAGWNGTPETVEQACRDTRLLWRSRPQTFGYTALPPTAEQYRKSLSSNKRQQLRSELKRINARDTVRLIRCRTVGEIPRFLDALFDLHGRRRQVLGDEGSFQKRPAQAEFYRRFAPVALDRGWLWLFALEDAGELRAVQLGYVYDDVFYQIQEGFDPEYVKGAGNVLRAHVIDECIAAGVRGLDFLANMSEHKRRWLAEPRTGCDLFIASPTLTNRLLFIPPIWPRGILRTVRSSSTCGLEGSDPNTSSEPEERKRKRERDDRP